ncbi:segregation/condensation protein A [Parenemella sanctibonifatiensis]|uniref:Segregation and condensation protein A n=1 Tax=Parenemella sanctibonifatiensis TaxID=2016505 RepID=A0A255EEN9_9ACTN|nr:segregation/condensation protein A [Parenemella sanctibonifatiensis]
MGPVAAVEAVTTPTPIEAEPRAGAERGFTVRLTNFEGPFDLLLQLISRHKLDVTEVALSQVTDDFLAHIRVGASGSAGEPWDLEQTSSFLLVAATLLDLKAARLLPSGEVEDSEDLELLEARDLLFARLLQYRAFKLVSGFLADRIGVSDRIHPRPGGLEDAFSSLLPPPVIGRTPEQLARLVAALMAPEEIAEVSLSHLHGAQVSVREQAQIVASSIRAAGRMGFADLVAGADRLTTVARFLALLELFRNRAVTFEQESPLGALTVVWSAADESDDLTAGIDEFDGVPDQHEDGGHNDVSQDDLTQRTTGQDPAEGSGEDG